ncbi:hypothetical protein FPV67DRAFT_63791 [Lyophyllum atratum]|nr:hypothetical protein FPV67DRAFT_63791 [Lyophyllum atratum]
MVTQPPIEPGVLSTSNPKGSDGFARNTAAIVGVAVACTILIIVAVIATFFACKRYKGRRAFGVSSPNVLRFTPWHPPLAGDDDNHYYTEQHGGLVTTSSQQHLERHAQPNEMASIGTERLSPERSVTHGGGSSDSGLSQPIPHPCFGQQSSVSYTRATDIALPFPYTAYMPSVPPPMSRPGPPNDISDSVRQQGDASNGAPSLHGGSSSHGHFATSTSSGHELLPAKALPSQSSPGPTSFKTLMGRLRPGRISLPDIVVHGSSSNSSPCESVSSYMRNLPPLLPGNSSLARPNTPTLDPPLSTWTPAYSTPSSIPDSDGKFTNVGRLANPASGSAANI